MNVTVSVSDCFNKHLKSLYLNEFPCISGNKESDDNSQVEELIDLIRDKKSPWHNKYVWSSNCDSIRESFIKNNRGLKMSSIEKYFTNLRFNDQNIKFIDPKLKKFVNLRELILTCNKIQDCDMSNLPESLKVFDLSGNYVKDLNGLNQKSKVKLEHFGLAFNWIFDVMDCFDATNWSSLVSLDLSYNQIRNLCVLKNELSNLPMLKNLILYGNPIVILPGYRGCLIDSLPKLFSLDDKVISREERINYLDFGLYSEEFNSQAEIKVTFVQIKNLVIPEIPDFEDGLELFVYKYFLRFYSINDDEDLISNTNASPNLTRLHTMISLIDTYQSKTSQRQVSYNLRGEETEELEPAPNIDLNEKGVLKLSYKSINQLRDFFLNGSRIELVQRKIDYQSKDFSEEAAVAAATDQKNKKKKNSKESEANKGKDAKKKKKKMSSMLDNYNKVKVDDKIIAKFDIELSPLLDGHAKEKIHKFTTKLEVTQVDANSNKISSAISKTDKKKKETGKNKPGSASTQQNNKKKAPIEAPIEIVETLPLELDFRIQVLDFKTFKEVKQYFDNKPKS